MRLCGYTCLSIFVVCLHILIPAQSGFPLFLNNDELIKALQRAETAAATVTDILQIDTTLMRFRSLNLPPTEELHAFYSTRMRDRALQYVNTERLTSLEVTQIWRDMLPDLVLAQVNASTFSKMQKYYTMGIQPALFSWYFNGERSHKAFCRIAMEHLQQDDMWKSAWQRVLTAGSLYLLGEVPITVPFSSDLLMLQFPTTMPHPGPYNYHRVDFVQTAFYHLIIKHTFGTLSQHFEQIVEFGGGTATNAVALRYLNFEGVHYIYDLPPMSFLQQYFLSFSGWPVYLGSEVSMPAGCTGYGCLLGRTTILGILCTCTDFMLLCSSHFLHYLFSIFI